MNFNEFYQGIYPYAYTYLGVHAYNEGYIFRVYAPSSHHVSLIGEFSAWREIEMKRINNGQFFEVYVNDAYEGDMYKYRIYTNEYDFIDHSDPYAFYSEKNPGTASRIYISHYEFQYKKPHHDYLNIYEVHCGSFKEGISTYQDLKNELIPYLLKMHYNAVELMPLYEYPNDRSWGYQATGYFSPTARYGTPDDLREFIDECHKYHILVILDTVFVHFAIDGYGLNHFDGTSLYEYPHVDIRKSEWGSLNFMHSKPDVQSFLLSSAYYWLKEIGFDGLRFDAISHMIYWQGDKNRGENRPALDFLRKMNRILKEKIPQCLLIAEDSSDYGKVTTAIDKGGLGFDYKWDLGWMNDTLYFFSQKYHKDLYHKLTFSMYYFYNEKYLLPLSHDEVVHGKKTIIDKMHGGYEEKFARVRLLYLYMMSHPGAKLNFMGNELAQFREWDEQKGQDFLLLDYPMHQKFHNYIAYLNKVYNTYSCLYQQDYNYRGFKWENCELSDEGIYVYRRIDDNNEMIFFMNVSYNEHLYHLKDHYIYNFLFSSDEVRFGGTHDSYLKEIHNQITLAPLSLSVYIKKR